jgi:hypothetical protein
MTRWDCASAEYANCLHSYADYYVTLHFLSCFSLLSYIFVLPPVEISLYVAVGGSHTYILFI